MVINIDSDDEERIQAYCEEKNSRKLISSDVADELVRIGKLHLNSTTFANSRL